MDSIVAWKKENVQSYATTKEKPDVTEHVAKTSKKHSALPVFLLSDLIGDYYETTDKADKCGSLFISVESRNELGSLHSYRT